MARTVLEEHLRFPAHLIEAQLAHAVRDANGRADVATTRPDFPDRNTCLAETAIPTR
jgi:hypothetical protein